LYGVTAPGLANEYAICPAESRTAVTFWSRFAATPPELSKSIGGHPVTFVSREPAWIIDAL
jgi:hypothetical protein